MKKLLTIIRDTLAFIIISMGFIIIQIGRSLASLRLRKCFEEALHETLIDMRIETLDKEVDEQLNREYEKETQCPGERNTTTFYSPNAGRG